MVQSTAIFVLELEQPPWLWRLTVLSLNFWHDCPIPQILARLYLTAGVLDVQNQHTDAAYCRATAAHKKP